MYLLNLEEDIGSIDNVMNGHKPRFWAKINGSFPENERGDATGTSRVVRYSLFCAAQKHKTQKNVCITPRTHILPKTAQVRPCAAVWWQTQRLAGRGTSRTLRKLCVSPINLIL